MPINHQKGSFLLYIILIVTLLLGIALGISGILWHQIKMLGEVGYSVVALYAADSGIEQVLVARNHPLNEYPTGEFNGSLSDEITYEGKILTSGQEDCSADNYCIKSIGTYKGTNRAIEIEY